MSRAQWFFLSLIAIMTVALAACQPQAVGVAPAPAAEQPEAAPAEKAAPAPVFEFEPELSVSPEAAAFYTPGRFDGQEITVVLSDFFFGEDRAVEQLRLEFEELTGAKVNYVPMPSSQMYDKVRLEMINNSGLYDMMHTGAGGAKDYGLSGFLVPLPTPPDVDDFYEGDVAQYSIGGQLYGLPMIADTNLLYWRTDLFEEAGLDPQKPPRTYDEFREYAIKLTTDVNGNHPGDPGETENPSTLHRASCRPS